MQVEFQTNQEQDATQLLNILLVSEQGKADAEALFNDLCGKAATPGFFKTEKHKKAIYNDGITHLIAIGLGDMPEADLENIRIASSMAISYANAAGCMSVAFSLSDGTNDTAGWQAIAESTVLSNYQFLNYKSEPKQNTATNLIVPEDQETKDAVETGLKYATAACISRDLVNEPVITLTAVEFSKRIEQLGSQYGFSVEVFNKKKIQSLKMGGLLAVNSGSQDPPTFSILEWKPENATNKKPIVLVGKGIVFDTGGLSLKPTEKSMDFMKSDMAGAAAVVGALAGVASLNLPVHVIGLIPATDNRPGETAYVPGDVITMFDGTTVEVLNTDAEGRLVLADALSYAKKYDPELVIDLATLTGAAVVALGTIGIAMMSTADEKVKNKLKEAGNITHERVVELPLWEEYRKQLNSDIADISNLGGRAAGTITAGKFLEHFTDYPWIHLDIAGPSFLHQADSYRGKNGTGAGVRLLIDFLKHYSK